MNMLVDCVKGSEHEKVIKGVYLMYIMISENHLDTAFPSKKIYHLE